MKLRLRKKLVLASALLFGLSGLVFSQVAGDYRSAVSSGNWGTLATWETFDGTNWIAASVVPTSSSNVWIQSNDTVIVEASAKVFFNLTVESGGVLMGANTLPTSSLRYIRAYGTTLTNNGTIGSLTDCMGIALYGGSGQVLTITGTGLTNFSRIQPQSGNQAVIFDADVNINYAGSSGTGSTALYTNGKDSTTFTINTGKTVTMAASAYVAAHSSSGTSAGTAGLTLTVNGSLVTGANGQINLRNTAPYSSKLFVGSTGSISVGGTLGLNSAASAFFAGSSTLQGTGGILVDSAATLSVEHAGGVNGVLQNSGTNTLSKKANYIFAGTSAQTMGTLTPDTVAGVMISNTGGVTMSSNVTTTTIQIDANSSLATAAGDTLFVLGKGTVDGILTNNSSVKTSDTLTFSNGSKYVHAVNGSSIPIGVWQTGSTVELTGIAGNAPSNGNQNFYNVVWNSPSQSANLNLGWNGNTIGGNINVVNTGSSRWQMCAPTTGNSTSVTINGNILVEGGKFTAQGTSNANTTVTIDVLGNINVTGGNLSVANGSQGGTGTTTWNVYGDFSMSNATTQNSNAAGAKFVFKKHGKQTLTLGAGNTLTSLPIEVDSGTTLVTGSSVLLGSGIFTLQNGAGIEVQHAGGLDSLLKNSGTKTLSTAADYTFNGTAGQVTGSLLPDTINTLTVANTDTLWLSDSLAAANVVVSSGSVFDVTQNLKTTGLTVSGHMIAADTVMVSDTADFNDGSVYVHAINGGTVPLGHWNAGSTLEITGAAGNAPNNGNQNFYNLTWNCPNQSTGLNLAMHENTIGGDIRVVNSNGQAVRLTNSSATNVRKMITINGSVYVDSSSGYFTATGSGGADTIDVVLKGNIVSKGIFQLANGSGALCNWFVGGDVQSLGGTFTTNSTATKPDSLIFNGTGTQLLVKDGSVSTMSNINFSVKSGSTLDVDTNNIGASSGTSFTVESGATLISGHASGINGNLTNAGATTLSAEANYVFDGAAAQVTGTKLPATVNNLTVNNAAGVSLSQLTTINGVLALKAGVFNNIIPFTLGAGGTISFEGGSLLLPLSLNIVSIAEARKDVNNDLIPDYLNTDTLKVYGIVTSPNFGTTYTSYFIQDATAGINVYKGGTKMDFAIGDSVFVIGKILQNRGLTEISPLAADSIHFGVLKHGAVVPQPQKLSLHEFAANAEQYEGRLVSVDTLYKGKGTWPGAGSSGSVYVTRSSSADTIQLYIDSDTELDGWTEPLYPINVVGVVSQYTSGASVYNDGYELMLRDTNDVVHITVLGVAENNAAVPIEYKLYQNYPNPFNPSTTINFTVAKQGMAKVKIYNTIGQEIATLFHQSVEPGKMYTVQFNAGRLSSGMYFSVFESEGHREIKKMLLMK